MMFAGLLTERILKRRQLHPVRSVLRFRSLARTSVLSTSALTSCFVNRQTRSFWKLVETLPRPSCAHQSLLPTPEASCLPHATLNCERGRTNLHGCILAGYSSNQRSDREDVRVFSASICAYHCCSDK
ncbi:hypothetical protein SCHPADRAFT_621648 [Schizopora paradoxa]|uniref:Uncharacterized protein n=1 Tax=Schizopora paradoxa TaxID=27342 RepID=A0A0H2R8D8_9AGAM|nr:hypothetical protein SCHPADRAFT_621648 [Schizopora paradoxa]